MRLFARGDAPDALYFVRSGCVAIHGGGDDTPVLLRTVHSGSAIGEMGFLRCTTRSATATAVDDTDLLVLTRECFDRLVRDNPAVEATLYRVFLAQMADRVEQLGAQAQLLAR